MGRIRKVLPMVLAICLGFAGGLLGQATANHYAGSQYFYDCSPWSPSDEDIGFAYEAGVVKGYSDGNYNPAWFVTREQMATYVMRSFATSPAMTVFLVDFMYFNGYYFGADAYSAGQISYDQYVQNQKQFDWYFQLAAYQVSQGNDTHVTSVGGAAVMRALHAQLRGMKSPAPPAPGR